MAISVWIVKVLMDCAERMKRLRDEFKDDNKSSGYEASISRFMIDVESLRHRCDNVGRELGQRVHKVCFNICIYIYIYVCMYVCRYIYAP